MTFREKINKQLKKFLAGGVYRESQINTSDFEEYLYILQDELRLFHRAMESLTVKELKKIAALVNEFKLDTKLSGIASYRTYKATLKGKAAMSEDMQIFSSLVYATKKCEKLIDQLVETYTNSLQKKTITLTNTQISDFAIMGAVVKIDAIAQFAIFAFTSVSSNVTTPEFIVPKYRILKMAKLNAEVASDVNDLYRGLGLTNITRNIKSIRKKNQDIKLIDTDGSPQTQFIGNIVPDSITHLLTGIFNINIFRWLGEIWINYRHGIYLKQEEEREWIQNHINMLRLDIGELGSEEERERLSRIIANYDAKISKLDRQITAYKDEL